MQDKLKKTATRWVENGLSLVRILFLSKWKNALPERKKEENEIIILGNGPSFKTLIDEKREFWTRRSKLMVNFSACSPYFEAVKPEYYLVADSLFWEVPDKTERLFGALAEKTDWPLKLFMPAKALKSKRWQELIAGNKQIEVFTHNTVPIEGTDLFAHWAYSKGLGVPRPHNVLIPSVTLALRMGFDRIYLAGAEHSWVHDVGISEDNRVVMNFRHFYDKEKPDAKEMAQYAAVPLYQILYHQYIIFKAYFQLRDYAGKLGKAVINITPGSFIDAFERQKI